MGEGETVSEVVEAPANGNVAVEDKSEAVAKDLHAEKDGTKEVKEEESKESDKDVAEKMDIDKEEAKETKGEEEVKENIDKEEVAKEDNEKEEEAKENNGKEEEVKETNETKEEEKPDQEIEVEEEKPQTKSEAMEEEPDNKDVEEEMAEEQDNKDEEMAEEPDNKDDDEEMAEEPENKDEEVREEGEKEDNKTNEKHKDKEGSKKSVKSKGQKDNKRKREVAPKKEKEPKTPAPPTIDRPVRERKSVERLVASIDREANKEFRIEKGRGTALKDIPNVAYKLTKKKTEDTFKLLHTILYGRRGKAAQIKSNISRFSGFVWHENEEKQKMKVKEKFDKYIKEKLLEFCDVLDIPVTKATSRKEDMVVKLMDFLEAPHATTTELLAEKDQSSRGKKRRRESKKVPHRHPLARKDQPRVERRPKLHKRLKRRRKCKSQKMNLSKKKMSMRNLKRKRLMVFLRDNRDMYLKHLNKISHKISKPIRKPAYFENQNPPQAQTQHAPPPIPPPPPPPAGPQNLQQQPQQQPPVYNINKSDFRDVVQKLTGSPAHERISTPPPIQQPKAASSRLQRIRPPPLAQISNRPPPFVNVSNNAVAGGGGGFLGGQRPVQAQPLSPLPPFPAVHASAESPISAYMRFLQSSIGSASTDSDSKRFSTGLSPLAPRWNNFGAPQQQPPFPPPQTLPLPHQQNIPPPPTNSSFVLPPFPAFPSSPLPFGCLPSPRSPYGLLSPGLLLSPSRQLGFQQLPLSPTLPVASPKWKGI